MTYREFTWHTEVGGTGKVTFNKYETQFGDGYKQTTGIGINNTVLSWPVEFIGRTEDVKPIKDFIEEHEGVKPFYWTPPLDDRALFDANDLSIKSLGGGIFSISATFTRRYMP